MNDRYLFKAKHVHTLSGNKHFEGIWIEGYLSDEEYIMSINMDGGGYLIDPSTICQCTGLKDKNGNLIWENDICIINGSGIDDEDGYFALEWENSTARFVFDGDSLCVDFDNIYDYECEVVGNIFDNPELLEVEP